MTIFILRGAGPASMGGYLETTDCYLRLGQHAKVIKVLSKAAAMVALAALVVAGLAYAGAPYAISGTVYSSCSGQIWYISSVARYKQGVGNIEAQFSVINPGGLTFAVLDQFNAQFGYQQSWVQNKTNILRTLASSVPDGKQFYNTFKQTSSDCGHSNYNFTGTEYY